MFETKVMVAPNSPTDLANPSTAPAITPGKQRGRVMDAKDLSGAAHSMRAAPSSRAYTDCIDSRIPRKTRGRDMVPAEPAAAVQRNTTVIQKQFDNKHPTEPEGPNTND